MRIGKWWIGRWLSQGGDDDTQVIFSLSVWSESPIEALAPMRSLTMPSGKPRADNEILYSIGKTVSFEDGNWDTRADKLDAAVNAALDLLDSTGVDPEEMRRPDVFVKAFFTFGEGAETISANIVERLARYNATIWIDA
jgi:hypothetical protein